MKPFFSIIIPTLNEEKYLPNLLKDFKKQRERDFEVIVVDGQSNDKTIQKVKQFYSEAKIILSKYKNLCYQRNIGAKASRGDYIIFLDADVRIYRNYLSEIKKNINKHSYLFLTTYKLPDNKNKLDFFLEKLSNYSLEILKLINKQMAPGFNFIIHKDIFKKVKGFNEKATMSEDHELSLRIQKIGIRLHIIPKTLLMWSYRRIKRDGYLPIILKYSVAVFYSIFFGVITNKKFGYQMGGESVNDK